MSERSRPLIGENTMIYPDREVPYRLEPCQACRDSGYERMQRYVWTDPDGNPDSYCPGCHNPLPTPRNRAERRARARTRG